MTTTAEGDTLFTVLCGRFAEEDAACLSRLIRTCFRLVNPRYEDIDMDEERKNECLLTAFGERIVLPARAGPSGGWNDRSLRLEAGEYYGMPPVVWHLMRLAETRERFLPRLALEETLRPLFGEEGTAQSATLFWEACKHARRLQVEAGLFGILARNLNVDLDLHETLDRFVLLGIASPHAKADVNTGLVWYELNPCLLW